MARSCRQGLPDPLLKTLMMQKYKRLLIGLLLTASVIFGAAYVMGDFRAHEWPVWYTSLCVTVCILVNILTYHWDDK